MWVNITLGVTPEMAEDIQDEADKHGMSRNKYLRTIIRNSDETQFDPAEITLVDDADAEEAQMGGA
jgi:hypothetical protein